MAFRHGLQQFWTTNFILTLFFFVVVEIVHPIELEKLWHLSSGGKFSNIPSS